jgi:peptidoglycan/xylan/chitin deacetylase (PgdA/CDA1 family)
VSGLTPRRAQERGVNLCLHGIGTPKRALEPDEERYWIDAATFEQILDVAADDPSIGLTFDDGNASDASIALPALLERGMTASFFVIGERIGQDGSLAAEEVRTLADAGMTVGIHGMRHRPWRSLNEAELADDLAAAVETVSAAAGRRVDRAACPFGSYDRRVLAALQLSGFAQVYTVDPRPAQRGEWLQHRFTVRSSDTARDVAAFGSEPMPVALVRRAKSAVKQWR